MLKNSCKKNLIRKFQDFLENNIMESKEYYLKIGSILDNFIKDFEKSEEKNN